jgi:hypothetical protein
MISVGVLWPDDRPAWETLFAGYNEFYGRTLPRRAATGPGGSFRRPS